MAQRKKTRRRTAKRTGRKKTSRRKSSSRSGARAIWKGTIQFASTKLPVKLYSAVTDKSVHFRLLDAKKHEPVSQHMVNPETGDVVEYADAKRAIQVGRNRLVIVDDDELEELEPEASREIEVTRFVSPDKITHQWYDRPYWLGPDGDATTYFALVEALRDQEKEGLARWTMRNKEYVGALRVEGDHLMLITLRHAAEVIPASKLEPPGGRDVSKRELEMARQLVEVMLDELDMSAYRDEYRDRVVELAEAKARGKVLRFPKARTRKTDEPLEAMLKRSLATAKKERASA